MSGANGNRFSGHESFVCRYGWLSKVFRAVEKEPNLLRDEAQAINTLGIGRNMVKSLQFWAEASGVVRAAEDGGHEPGAVGSVLFSGPEAWDQYLESLESLWLIHWHLTVKGGLAAWREVFAESRLVRFDRKQLIEALARRGAGAARTLAASTLEQHASIFVQSYYQEERGTDDTSWSPLQDLALVKATKGEDGRTVFNTESRAPVGLTCRVFGIALSDFIAGTGEGEFSMDFERLLKDVNSPGFVFRMDEHQLRMFIETMSDQLPGALRFVDTADTQSVVLNTKRIDPKFRLRQAEGAVAHV
jgi:hypothetical protein